jgi:hypothetical protein
MKTILSAVIALTITASIATPAGAVDAKRFYEQTERYSGN